MTLNELRIGNYYHWYAEGKNYSLKVDAKVFSNENYKNFDPIPLTEEWLVKFGFEKTNKLYDTTEVFEQPYCPFVYFRDKEVFFAFKTKSIKYVHEFQNIFYYLTGDELILNEPL